MTRGVPVRRRRYECLRCGAHTLLTHAPEEDTTPRCTVCGSISMHQVRERGPTISLVERRVDPPR